MSLNYLFAKPDYIQGIDKDNPICIYPIKLKDYDEFTDCSKFLYVSKNHFADNEYPLLALLFMSKDSLKISHEDLVKKLCRLFSLVTHEKVIFVSTKQTEGFLINNINMITVNNYDLIRGIIMKHNLMFEEKVYKDKLVQEWANKVLQAKQKNSIKITIEDYITTVKNYNGLTYEQMMEQTIYQLYADFYRIGKMKDFDKDVIFRSVSDKWDIQYFAENINMFKSPYDDLFVDSNKLNKFKNL